jgi:50S ribosomal protein L16 3-hydroxylase
VDMCAARLGLAELFPSLEDGAFVTQYWPRQVHWAHAPAERFASLSDLDSIGGIVALSSRSRMILKSVLAARHHETNEIPIDASSILSLYDSGATIVCNELHRWHESVAACAVTLASDLSLPPSLGGCNLYLSPPGRGLPMHFDNHEVFVVQLAGSKRWRLAENRTVKNPTQNSGPSLSDEVAAYAHGPAPKRMPRGTAVQMTPGSVLFVPRGVWHETDATEPSISLTFGFRTPTWSELLCKYAAAKLPQDPEWREPAWYAWDVGKNHYLAEKQWSELKEGISSLFGSARLLELAGPRDPDEIVEPSSKPPGRNGDTKPE